MRIGIGCKRAQEFFEGDENVPETDHQLPNSESSSKVIELYALNRCILWYVNYNAVKLLKRKELRGSVKCCTETAYPEKTPGNVVTVWSLSVALQRAASRNPQ